MSCPPRYATRRRPERETFGHELGNIAGKLGQPLMPWQRYVADVACEVDPLTGLPAYREVRVTIPRQSGKALDVSTPILTCNRGWTTMGEIRPGDAVFHPDGFPVTVAFVSEVMEGHDCFRVTTVDGRSVIADAEHLWTVTDKRHEKSKGTRRQRVTWFEQRTITTREMLDGGLSRYAAGGRSVTTGGKRYATNEYRFSLPDQGLLKSPNVELPVDPYLLGGWLGDGCTGKSELTCHVDDSEHWAAVIAAAGFVPVVHPGGGTPNTRHVSINAEPGKGRHGRTFAFHLRALGIYDDKHVPDAYLTAGTAQREALLQGLLDTDGTIDAKRGQVEYCSMLPHLAEAVLLLARSLGWRATLRTGRAKLNGRDYGTKYRVCFTPKRSDPACPFRMPRKVARIQERDGGKGRATLSIASIEPVESRAVRCIKVDSPDGLFLAGRDLVPTHNTTLFLSWQIHRCVARRWAHPQRSAFTAQTGKDARDKWIDELFPLIRNSKLKTLVAQGARGLAINEGMGNESIRFRTGSIIRLLSTSAGSGHSKTLDQAVVDELWHDVDDRREQGLRPAMITKRDAQLLVCSTAGTIDSVVLNRKIETGRLAVVEDTGHGVAYFEWSASDDWDPDDWDSYFSFSPALCPDPPCRCAPPGENWRHTITLDALKVERDSMELVEFKRAYGNVMAGVQDLRWQVIAKPDWENAGEPDLPSPEQRALAVTVAPDQAMSYICAAGPVGTNDDGKPVFGVAILDARPGVSWVLDRLVERHAAMSPVAVAIDRNSAAEQIWLQVEAHNANAAWDATKVDNLASITPRDECAASMAFARGICGLPGTDDTGVELEPRSVKHRCQPELDSAVAGAAKKMSGAMWRWDELGPVDVSALKGVSEALHAYLLRQPPTETPWVWDGRI